MFHAPEFDSSSEFGRADLDTITALNKGLVQCSLESLLNGRVLFVYGAHLGTIYFVIQTC